MYHLLFIYVYCTFSSRPKPIRSINPEEIEQERSEEESSLASFLASEEEESEGEETLEPQNLKKQKLESEQRVAREMTHTVHTPSTKQNVSIRIQIPNSVNISEGKETPKSVSTKEEQKEEEKKFDSNETPNTMEKMEEINQANSFQPTKEWLESWRQQLPMNIPLKLIESLEPKIQSLVTRR